MPTEDIVSKVSLESKGVTPSSLGPIALLVQLERQFTHDSPLDQRTLHERDRKIGLELDLPKENKYQLLLAWLSKTSSQENQDAARKLDSLEKLISLVLTLAGLLIGSLISAAVFRYDGSIPINVITVLLLCVVLPFITTVLTLFALLPNAALRWLPGGRSLQHLLQGVSTARLRDLLVYYLPQAYKKNFEYYSSIVKRQSILYGAMRNWKLVHSAQVFTSSLLLGLLLHFSFLIISSDLAFGWSTTLGVESAQLHKATNRISLPWSAIYPRARPSHELIDASRFFRFKDGTFGTSGVSEEIHPDKLGAWWPFLTLSIATYGVLPRLILLCLSAFYLKKSARIAAIKHPNSENVIWRLTSPLISTQASEKDLRVGDPTKEVSAKVEGLILTEHSIVVNWAQLSKDSVSLKNYLLSLFPKANIQLLPAGGNASLDEDQLVIEKIVASERKSRIIIAVKSWEPPTEDILDFVKQLREGLGQHTLIFILPLEHEDDRGYLRAKDSRMRVWLERFSKLADPWTQIVTTPRSS
jgi:hypothetical protein